MSNNEKKLTSAWKPFSDPWVNESCKEEDDGEGGEEDEELSKGPPGDEEDELFVEEEIFDTLQGDLRQTIDLRKNNGNTSDENKK